MNFISLHRNVKIDGDWKAFKYEFFMINLLLGDVLAATQQIRTDNGVCLDASAAAALISNDTLRCTFGEISIMVQIVREPL
jgi:hypothetical protein